MQAQSSLPSPFLTSLLAHQPSGDTSCQPVSREASVQSQQSHGSQLVRVGSACSEGTQAKVLRRRLSLVEQELLKSATEETLKRQHSSQQQMAMAQQVAEQSGTSQQVSRILAGSSHDGAVLVPSNATAGSAVDLDGSASSSSTLSAATDCQAEEGDSSSMILSTPSNLAHMDTTAPLDTLCGSDDDNDDDPLPATPGGLSSCSSYGPFAAFQNHAYVDSGNDGMAAAASGDWLIRTASSSTGHHSLRSSASRRASMRASQSVCTPCAEEGEEADATTDPLTIAAHAVIAAAAATAPPGTTTSAADMHTLLATCNDGTVLLLGHGSTTIGPSTAATGPQALAALEDVLQQHRATCSLCSLSSLGSPLGQASQHHHHLQQQQQQQQQPPQLHLQQQSIDESTELNLTTDNSISLVLPRRRIAPISSARAGQLFRPSSSSGAAAAAAMAAAGANGGDRLDTSDSCCSCRSVLVLGLGSGVVDVTAACPSVGCIAAAASAPAGQQQRPGNLPTGCPIMGIAAHASAPPALMHQQQQQPQQPQQPQQQPVMQLLSCSTLLSPSCSSTKLGTLNSCGNSCLRLGSANMAHIFQAGQQAGTAPAAASSQGKQQQLPSKARADSQGSQQQQGAQEAQQQLIFLLD